MKNDLRDSKIPFPEEINHLCEITQKLEEALQDAKADVSRIDREYRDAKRYMAEYRGEIDPNEMFQNELLLKQTDETGGFAVSIQDKISKLKESPYFARIDFQGQGYEEPEEYYIGRFTFRHDYKLLIYDWRAPIASMFYDYEVGPAGYEAPMGRIDGEMTRKRQFKITNGVMEYALETSSHVQDDILQKELSHTSDEKMKSIIATIQKEQNQIIRSEKLGTLIIQGAAGSGKTSIALHRIAFLLYRFRDRLNARNVAILSPNKVFGDYISNVIPELGEEPIYELSLMDIAKIQLECVIKFEPDKDPLEAEDERWMERVRFKSTMEFLGLLEDYIMSMTDWIFSPADYTYESFTAKGEWIRGRFLSYVKYPVKKRLSMVADDIYHRFQGDNIRHNELPEIRTILKSLTSMLRFKSTLALYKEFYRAMGKPQMFVMPEKNVLEWEDVYPFLYMQAAFVGLKESGITRHLVIDEMQDYTPIQYAVLNKLFPCQKTILGDFGQSLNPYHSHTLMEIRRLYEGAEFVQLTRSYRSTYEIMTFAKRIQNITSLDAVKRHGEEPVLVACKSEQDEIRQVKDTIRNFEAGENKSLGIVMKTNQSAKIMYDLLSEEVDISLISPYSSRFSCGVSITSVRMAKGLEFDEVLVPQANDQMYASEYDRSLLYIACTRAMHRLTLVYVGNPSAFLPLDRASV